MSIRQVAPLEHWPSGDSRPVAVLALEPDALAERYGLAFAVDVDDLDRYRLAAVELDDGQQVWLLRHVGDPNPGTVVRVDARADVEAMRHALVRAFGLSPADIIWSAPVAVGAAR